MLPAHDHQQLERVTMIGPMSDVDKFWEAQKTLPDRRGLSACFWLGFIAGVLCAVAGCMLGYGIVVSFIH